MAAKDAKTLAERLAEVEERLAALEAMVVSDAPAAVAKSAVGKGAGKKKAEESAEEDAA